MGPASTKSQVQNKMKVIFSSEVITEPNMSFNFEFSNFPKILSGHIYHYNCLGLKTVPWFSEKGVFRKNMKAFSGKSKNGRRSISIRIYPSILANINEPCRQPNNICKRKQFLHKHKVPHQQTTSAKIEIRNRNQKSKPDQKHSSWFLFWPVII